MTLFGFCLELSDGTLIEAAGWGVDMDEAFIHLDIPLSWEDLDDGDYEFEFCALATWEGPHIVYWITVAEA